MVRISKEMEKILLAVLLATLVSGIAGFNLANYIELQQTENENERVRKAVSFLVDLQFNQMLNLTREGTSGNRTGTYWLLSDNLLASKALWPYNASVAARIWNRLMELGYTRDFLHEALFGQSIPTPPSIATNYTIDSTPVYTIKLEYHNSSSRFNDYQEYGDLLVYIALSSEWLGNHQSAVGNFTKAVMMWDGKGIRDKAFNGEYQTYKLALLLYASRILSISLQQEEEMENLMWAMQRSDGGLWTGYGASFKPVSEDANTETTALAILAGS